MAIWKKIGRIFNPRDYTNIDWLDQFAQAPATLIFDDFVRVYFSCRPKPINGQFLSDTAWVDFDRKDLTKVVKIAEKPILPRGNKGSFDEFGIYPTSVIRSKDEVVAYYGGWTRCESVPFNVAIGRATSKDKGLSFIKDGEGPIISFSIDEPFVISSPKIRKFGSIWYLFYIAGKKWIPTDDIAEPVYQIRMASSKDGLNWKKENKDLIPTQIENDECQASPDVILKNGIYHMFFCFRKSLNFRGKEGGYRIGYASSTDLINWARDDSKAGIDISETGWDSEMVAYPHVFELDGEIYMLYLGNHVGREGFGLAKLSGKL
tara:strand:+ start:1215 stop:2171 length:957 start_codon:yes stop_codon:yes gene_type:complete